jgi:hypothetical protein
MKRGSTAILLLLLGSPCLAHHGVTAHYDADKPVTIDGIVVKFDFINPHAFVYVEAVDAAGERQVWQCELASRSVLARNGLTPDLFKPGAWAMKEFSVSMYAGVLTPAGERARELFDPIKDDPAIYCDPASPVRFWVNVNEPFEIRREGDAIVIDHQFMDSQRVVHLNAGPPGPDVARSSMGHSTGRFEGEALVVSTDHFSAAMLEPRRGVMHTQDLELTETLEVNEDTGELEITWVIDDPAYFKEPLLQTEYFVRTQRASEPYDCKPGYQQ